MQHRSIRSPFVVTATKNSSVWREYDEFEIDYEVVQVLGEGGFGRVLLVRNRKRNVQFAMKELEESGPDVYREVELLVTLTRTHPHVVSYFDRFVRTDPATGAKKHCIMMDYVRGVNLYDYVKKGKPVNNQVVYWFLRSALEALSHLHEMRISHRDIKPENYIVAPYRVDDDGSVVQRLVTIDFGLGSFLKRGGYLYAQDAEEVVGTANYSSPQMIAADKAGEKWLDAKADDVWALGASFYYLCMGKPVAQLHSGSWSHSWKEVKSFKCPATVWPHHRLLNKIIVSALMKDHEKRPPAAELLRMLMEGWQTEVDGKKKRRDSDETFPLDVYEDIMEADANDGVPDPEASVKKPKRRRGRDDEVEKKERGHARRVDVSEHDDDDEDQDYEDDDEGHERAEDEDDADDDGDDKDVDEDEEDGKEGSVGRKGKRRQVPVRKAQLVARAKEKIQERKKKKTTTPSKAPPVLLSKVAAGKKVKGTPGQRYPLRNRGNTRY